MLVVLNPSAGGPHSPPNGALPDATNESLPRLRSRVAAAILHQGALFRGPELTEATRRAKLRISTDGRLMDARQIQEHVNAIPASRSTKPARAGGHGSAALVLGLQRSVGNAAVARHLARPSESAEPAPVVAYVQRCGPVPCDCSTEERAQYEATHSAEGGQQVQRVPMPGVDLQRYPGDGMAPPGDCGYAQYIGLRIAVESAKAVVSMLGACAQGDSCTFLATKIAAISAEIAARVALDATCFKGGDTGHRQQVQDKVNMLTRCYRFFTDSGCPSQLIEAMAAVVAAARAAIEATMMMVAAVAVVAVVAALVAAIAALIEVIAALAAAAAEAASILAALAAAAAAIAMIRQNISVGAPSA